MFNSRILLDGIDTGSHEIISRSDLVDQEYKSMTSLMGHNISSISETMGNNIDVLMGLDVIRNMKTK